ncbi:MAG TPA: hypothetical protein EYP16_02800 [Candidatus Atribacteria bacterium]|nr:hypothetical protein [Candidatus Atribacteria bacterium]
MNINPYSKLQFAINVKLSSRLLDVSIAAHLQTYLLSLQKEGFPYTLCKKCYIAFLNRVEPHNCSKCPYTRKIKISGERTLSENGTYYLKPILHPTLWCRKYQQFILPNWTCREVLRERGKLI